MATALGSNVKITAPESARARARDVFRALGAKLVTPSETMDVFALAGGNVGFEYVADAEALTPAQLRRAPWLELVVDEVAATTTRLAELGLPRLDYRDQDHPYFIGPGGFVFRLAAR